MTKDSDELEKLVKDICRQKFGIDRLYPYQISIILDIAAACSTEYSSGEELKKSLTILPTGAGKSLCYMLPCFLFNGYTLLVYPLNALISDQYERFTQSGISAGVLRGGMTGAERNSLLESVADGSVRALLTNPETLLQRDVQQVLTFHPPVHIVVDEVHTMAEWGTTFRPAFLEAASFMQSLDFSRLSAFTATASPELLRSITAILFPEGVYSFFSRTPAKDNIAFSVRPSLCKDADLTDLIIHRPVKRPLIVFCATRRETEETARLLQRYTEPDKIRFYHAGLDREEKKAIELWFRCGNEKILTATCAFGLGIDAKGVRTVIHRTPPGSIEAYIQETGRAGRDGSLSRAVLLMDPEDLMVVDMKDTAEETQDRKKTFLSACTGKRICRRVAYMQLFSPEEEQPACGICDICTGENSAPVSGAAEVLEIANRFPRLFSPLETAGILKGYRSSSSAVSAGESSSSFGALAHWEFEWCQTLVAAMLASGAIAIDAGIRKKAVGPIRTTALGRKLVRQWK